MSISINRDLRLPDSEYFGNREDKSGICIHHTVGGSARSTFNWWRDDNKVIGTAYLIARNGTVHEVFDPNCWAWEFGLRWPSEQKIAFEKRYIGVEIASEGGLKESGGNLYCFDRISDRTLKNRDEAFDYGQMFRGYRYFDKYEPAQVDSLGELINDLCAQFNIPKETPAEHFKFYGEKLKDFKGIIGHSHVRTDKSDPVPDQALWDTLINTCGLQTVDPKQEPAPPPVPQLDVDLDALFEHNVQQINQMNAAAGSMVKGLIMELQRGERDTYIKLRDAVTGGHKVNYDFIKGDPGLVFRIANAFGFKTVTNDTLEVRHA
jgi:N-acetyl-anhydromuramyl-L-alanine amidase AmpD